MKQVTKEPRGRVKCQWCRQPFLPKPLGRAPKFCAAGCRQAACVRRNGTWEMRQREIDRAAAENALRRQLRESLRPEVRLQLTREFIQSGLVRITGPDHVNALIAGRNEWRGNKLLDELAADFTAAGNIEAAAAIREWKLRAQQASGRKRSAAREQAHPQGGATPALEQPAPGEIESR